ncbi:hypothetical protein PMI13_00102 [Chryseobacterium populi]|uniref:Uncharacterized protein n=1 Tax=Chryseobacterium populi TaxID=1144316 RepID=J2TD72_9FLAO|nr:hypothetical protein PMI13_00102 [Chryseobacterium populi]
MESSGFHLAIVKNKYFQMKSQIPFENKKK